MLTFDYWFRIEMVFSLQTPRPKEMNEALFSLLTTRQLLLKEPVLKGHLTTGSVS